MSSPRSLGSPGGANPEDPFYESRPLEDQYDDRTQVEETQFAGVEIDTQATAGYDLDDALQPNQLGEPQLPPRSNFAARVLSMPQEDVDEAPTFSFSRAQKKPLAIAIPRKGAEQATDSSKEAQDSPAVDKKDAPSNTASMSPTSNTQQALPRQDPVMQKPLRSSPPKVTTRAPLSDSNPNRQLSMNVNTTDGESGLKMPAAVLVAPVRKQERSHVPLPAPIMTTTTNEPLLPPFTQVAQEAPARKIRRKKTAPAVMQHDAELEPPSQLRHNSDFEVAAPPSAYANQQYQEFPYTETIESDHMDVQKPNMNYNISFMVPADNGQAQRRAPSQQGVGQSNRGQHNARPSVISATMPIGRAEYQQAALRSSPERATATASGGGQAMRPAQPLPKQQIFSSLPFPEAAVPAARRDSPNLVNRPLTNSEVQPRPVNIRRPVAGTGRVSKRNKSTVGIPTNSRAQTSNRMPDTQSQGHGIDSIQEHYTVGAGHDSAAVAEEQNDAILPSTVTTHAMANARATSHSSMSAFDIIDQAKNMMTAQVLEKDRELAHLKAEVRRLAQTVQGLEVNVGKLEGEKAILRDVMHKKCEGLKEKVGELLKDHKAVGGFIEKTNNEIAKFNKYKEKSGSIFKEAITKYADLQKHQKKTMEAIHETRIQVAHDVADLTKAHSHESGIVLKDLQAEKKKVFELEKAIDAEKHKVMHLETRLDAGLGQSLTAMLEKQNETFAAKVENQGKELLVAIDAKQEEKTASLKDYIKTLQSYKEHETEASKSIGELLSLVTALSAKVSEALQSKDAAQDGLQRAGTEVLNSIKEKVESITDGHSNQAELTNRVLLLETTKINLESHLKSGEQAKSDLQSQLESKSLELEHTREQIQLKDQELESLGASMQQGTARAEQEADDLRSSLATLSEELKKLRAFNAKLQDDHQSLQAQNSRLVDEGETAKEHLRRFHESTQQNAEKLKTSADEKARVLSRAEAAETKIAELQAKLTEETASAKQQLEAERIKHGQDMRRAVATAQQRPLSELTTLKKRYEKLETENTSLKDTIAAHSGTDHLEAEITRLQRENSQLLRSHASDLDQYRKAFNSHGQQIESFKVELAQLAQAREVAQMTQAREVPDQMAQLDRFKERFETATARMESRLIHHENIEMKIRAYCEQHNWDYDEMDVENFLLQISTHAVEEYRRSLNSSFSMQYPRPSMPFGQTMTAAGTTGSPAQHSQSSTTQHRAERTTEIIQVPGTQTPQRSRRSPSMANIANRSPHVAMVSPPRARRNHSIAERRRNLASSSKPQTPDTSGTPIRQPSDRTTGSGGRGHRGNPALRAGSVFDIPDSSEEPSQRRSVGPSKASRSSVPQSHAKPMRPSGDGTGKPESDFSDLSEIMDMMDQNPKADPISALEQQRRERASSIVEDNQNQRSKQAAVASPATPRDVSESQSHEARPLKGILKKRSHAASQETEEAQAPPRKQLQPQRGKNSLASLGTGHVGFRPSQDAGPSRAAGSQSKAESVAESSTAAAQFDASRPSNTTAQRSKRSKTMRGPPPEPEVETTPVAKKARMSIPYKPSASGSKKK